MQEAVVGLVGVLVGIGITSGYSFWAVRRSEMARGLIATYALDDEARWLAGEIVSIVKNNRRGGLTAPLSGIWDEQRGALVLVVDYDLFCVIGAGFQAARTWQRMTSDPKDEPFGAQEVKIARKAVTLLDETQPTLVKVGALLRQEHDTIIVVSLLRGSRDWLFRRKGRFPISLDDVSS